MSVSSKQDLGYKGQDFQYRAAKALIEDQNLFKKMYKILDHNCFTEPTLRRILGTQKELYSKNKIVPSYYEIVSTIRNREKDETELQYIDETIDKLKRTTSDAQYFTENELLDFMKWKYAILNVNKALEKLKEGYDEKVYKNFLKECDILTNPEEIGSEIKYTEENAIRVLTESDSEVVPTGIKEIDDRLAGGVGRTELGLFTALTGYGKTTFGSVVAFNAAMRGYKVLQIYFEDKETNMMRKQFSLLNGNRRINDFKKKDEETAAKAAKVLHREWKKLEENHKLLKMLNKQTTVEDIEDRVDYYINNENFRPDLIIIDYFSCLKFSRNAFKDVWAAQSDCMRKIQAMADKYNLAVWVLQQNNRPSPEKTAGMGNWQGAYEATQSASVWIELQRTAEQKQNGRADLIFNKTRNSQPKDDLYDIIFDNSRMLIDCSNSLQNDDEDLIYKDN